MNYNAVIFDFDGVLIDSESIYPQVWKDVLDDSYSFNSTDITGKSDIQFLDSIQYPGNYNKIISKKLQLTQQYLSNKIIENELKEFIVELFQSGIKISIASNNQLNVISYCLKNNKLEKYFSFVATANENLKPKPDPAIFKFVHKNLGITKKCLVVEDSEIGIKGAIAANLDYMEFNHSNFDFSMEFLRNKLSEI